MCRSWRFGSSEENISILKLQRKTIIVLRAPSSQEENWHLSFTDDNYRDNESGIAPTPFTEQIPAEMEEYNKCGESCLEFGNATSTCA